MKAAAAAPAKIKKAGSTLMKKRPHFDPEIECTRNQIATQDNMSLCAGLRWTSAKPRPTNAQRSVAGASLTAVNTA